MQKKTLVLGASLNPRRYSYMAVVRLRKFGHPVIAIGKKEGMIEDIPVITEKMYFQDIHTVTLYLNPKHQQEYIDYIISLKPQRIIFNPGAENDTFYATAKAKGIQAIEACTLVMLSTSQY
ncbi:MAG: CoA-binding protein [Chitinophagaceae bacterium]|nr:CoA-binding protein [Chitinophagaceae bacterium]